MTRIKLTPRFLATAAAVTTVVFGSALFVYFDILRPAQLVVDAASPERLEAVNGLAFLSERGTTVISEPLGHIRLPVQRTILGKRMRIQPRFHLDEGDVLEVGVKKSSFWLDYDRLPLQHRLLDILVTRDERPWTLLRDGARVVYLNPAFRNAWTSVENFLQHPPTDGRIGLYGHAVLSAPDQNIDTAPFRVADNPDTFRAIYAFYPEPRMSDAEWTTNEQVVDLSRAYQNADGSVDVMFFMQRADGGPIRVLVKDVTFLIEPGWPTASDFIALARRNLSRLLRRPPVSY